MKTPDEWMKCRDFLGGDDTVERMQALIAEVQQDAQCDLRNALQALYTAAFQYEDILHSDAMTLAEEVLEAFPAISPKSKILG
jgi:hypothetical protein